MVACFDHHCPSSTAAAPAGGEDLPDPLARHQARQQEEEQEEGVREEEESGRGQAEEGGEEGQEQRVSG